MATKPKAKAAEAPAAEPAAGGGKKKMIMIIIAAIIASGAAAGGAVWFMGRGASAGKASAPEVVKTTPAVFVPLEPFTVNLLSENADQFLQVTIHLQVADAPTQESIKGNLAIVRNRILILLSSKKASEITSVEGKEALAQAIIDEVKKPFTPKGKEQDVSGALFTSFIIQ
jgi:flagellar protein FliL